MSCLFRGRPSPRRKYWEIRLIDQGISADDVRQIESYWKHELDKFQPNGLNEREVALFQLNFS